MKDNSVKKFFFRKKFKEILEKDDTWSGVI